MKRFLAVLLIVIMAIFCTACSVFEKEPEVKKIELNAENFADYIGINSEITNVNVTVEPSLVSFGGITMNLGDEVDGTATMKVSFVPIKNVVFEDLRVDFRLYHKNMGSVFHWVFDNGTLSEETFGSSPNTYTIPVTSCGKSMSFPTTGYMDLSEDMHVEMLEQCTLKYEAWYDSDNPADSFTRNLYPSVEILYVSGYAIEN